LNGNERGPWPSIRLPTGFLISNGLNDDVTLSVVDVEWFCQLIDPDSDPDPDPDPDCFGFNRLVLVNLLCVVLHLFLTCQSISRKVSNLFLSRVFPFLSIHIWTEKGSD